MWSRLWETDGAYMVGGYGCKVKLFLATEDRNIYRKDMIRGLWGRIINMEEGSNSWMRREKSCFSRDEEDAYLLQVRKMLNVSLPTSLQWIFVVRVCPVLLWNCRFRKRFAVL